MSYRRRQSTIVPTLKLPLTTGGIVQRLVELKPYLHNTSTRPHKRLVHSMAILETAALTKCLPTSARKGYERGRL